jgi:hypothetical protein
MRARGVEIGLIVLVCGAVVAVALGRTGDAPSVAEQVTAPSRTLKTITLNTGAYPVAKGQAEKRSVSIAADEDMHIVALEHFTGVGMGTRSDNGHILSTSPENPWVKWESDGTGMEPTGTRGYFGYCGRDYYSEVAGIQDVMAYESLPAGTHITVRRGEKLYMHCYAANFNTDPTGFFHHAVRVLYW